MSYEENFRLLLDLSPDAISIHLPTGGFIDANAAALKLFAATNRAELLSGNILDLILPQDRDAVKDKLQHALTIQPRGEPACRDVAPLSVIPAVTSRNKKGNADALSKRQHAPSLHRGGNGAVMNPVVQHDRSTS